MLKQNKLPGHTAHNDFLFAEISEEAYKQLAELLSTLVQPKAKFDAAKEKAKEITNAVNERNKAKAAGETPDKPKSAIPEVQLLFTLNDNEYLKLQEAIMTRGDMKCDWLTHCCNIGLLPFDKNKKPTGSGITDEQILKIMHVKEYKLFSELVQIEFQNPAIEYEAVRKDIHKAIKTTKSESSDPVIQKWLDMTAGEYHAAIDTVKYWNGQESCDLLTLYCRTVNLLPVKENPTLTESMQNDRVILKNAHKNSRAKSLPELPELVSRIHGIREKLLVTVLGQENAVNTFCEGIFNAEALAEGDTKRKRPKAVFTFVGPPGMGKSFLAGQAAELLGLPYKKFDMTNYSTNGSNLNLIGFEYTWRDSSPGTLTTFVRDNPHCILVFDEIEAAHEKTINIFCSLLEDGIITDNFLETRKVAAVNGHLRDEEKAQLQTILNTDPTVSFKDSIIIFTSNAGRSLYDSGKEQLISRKTLLNALKTEVNPLTKEPYFPAAIVSRIATSYPIMFNYLEPRHLERIVRNEFERCRGLFITQYGINVIADKYVPVSLLLREGGNTDARTLRAQAELFFKEQVYKVFGSHQMSAILPNLRTIHIQTDSKKLPDVSRMAAEHKVLSFEAVPKFATRNIYIKLRNFEVKRAPDAGDIRALLADSEKPDVRFIDVIGAEAAKEELRYFVKYLQEPEKFLEKSQKPPKGILLHGAPGTGKTLLAQAMAGESDVAFFSVNAAMFTSGGVVGSGQKAITELFAKARRYAPSVIFIDEIDAIGRVKGSSGYAEEMALNALLTEMDGFSANDPKRPVFVLAATNIDVKANILEPALIRRFDRCIEVPLPDRESRYKYLALMLGKSAHSVSEDTINLIAERSSLMSLSDLSDIFELAVRTADRNEVILDDGVLLNAYDEIIHGEVRNCGAEYSKIAAYHEAGHAYLSHLSGRTPSYISIIARGGNHGYVENSGSEALSQHTRDSLLALLRSALGGRAAEIARFGNDYGISTGAASDLKTATNIAKSMIMSYGMDDEFGLAVISLDEAAKGLLAEKIHEKVSAVLKVQLDEAVRIIESNLQKVSRLAEVLLEKNSLTRLEIERILV
jgi:ATP-dependent metalloprotease FtsH